MTADALARLEAELLRCPYHEFLRPQAVEADDNTGTVVVLLPYRPEFRLALDSNAFHGGVLAGLVDLTGHATVAMRIGRVAPTIDLRIDYLRPARGEALRATGTLLAAGRSVARADVFVRDPTGRAVAAGRASFSTLGYGPGVGTV